MQTKEIHPPAGVPGDGFLSGAQSGEIELVAQVGGVVGLILPGAVVVFGGAGAFAQPVVADAQLDAGQVAVAVGADESARTVVAFAGERELIPEGRLPVARAVEKMLPDVAADLCARRIVLEGAQQRGKRRTRLFHRVAAPGEVAAGLDVVFDPAASPVQERLKHADGVGIAAVVVELARVVELVARRELSLCGELLFVDAQVARRVGGTQLAVGNGGVPVNDDARGGDRLMHRSRPAVIGAVADDPFAVVGEGGLAVRVERRVVAEHDDVGGGVEGAFELEQRAAVCFQKDVVRVEPHAVFHLRLGEGKIPRGGKVVGPREVIDLVGIPPRDLPGRVGGAGVHNDDLVRRVRRAFEAAGEDVLLVLDDHAQADGDHGTLLYRFCRPNGASEKCALPFKAGAKRPDRLLFNTRDI